MQIQEDTLIHVACILYMLVPLNSPMCPVLASGLGCSLSSRSEPTHLGEVTVAQGAEQRPPEPAPPPRRVAADHVLGLPALRRPTDSPPLKMLRGWSLGRVAQHTVPRP